MRIMFLSPHAAIWVHAFPEALVAESLAERGHEVLYVTCGREFKDHCNPMSAAGVSWSASDEEKARVCRACEKSELLLRKQFGFRGYSLNSRLTPQDRADIDRLVLAAAPDNYLDLTVDGVAVGRYALYEMLLNRKKGRLEFAEDEWREYLASLRNSLASLFACRRIFDDERPERLVVYNSLYSVNRVACMLAESRGIAAYFLHAGGNLSHRLETLLVGRGDGVRFYDEMLAYWPRVRDAPCSPEALSTVTDHLLELLTGRSYFTYSSARTADSARVRRQLGIPAGVRVLIATMSSPDERFAAATIGVMKPASSSVFADQADWIREVCAWVATRPDLFLVVRVHPREFPNKREAVTSEHARQLRQSLAHLPANATVNWPTDEVSLYDLADVADVFLNAWSAAGKEMSLLGIPVIAYAPELLVYPPDLNYVASSKAGYFSMIDQAMAEGWDLERIRMAYRWCVLEYEHAALHIRESFPWAPHRPAARARMLLRRLFARAGLEHWTWWYDCIRRLPLGAGRELAELIEKRIDTPLELLAQGREPVSLKEETLALRKEMARVAGGLYGNALPSGDFGTLRSRLEEFAAADSG